MSRWENFRTNPGSFIFNAVKHVSKPTIIKWKFSRCKHDNVFNFVESVLFNREDITLRFSFRTDEVMKEVNLRFSIKTTSNNLHFTTIYILQLNYRLIFTKKKLRLYNRIKLKAHKRDTDSIKITRTQ